MKHLALLLTGMVMASPAIPRDWPYN